MLSTIEWPQIAAGAVAAMTLLGAWYGIVELRNGRAEKKAGPPPMPPTFPCPKHGAQLQAHDHEIVELRKTDNRQWDAITEQGKLQANMKGTLDGVAANVDRLVEKLL